MTETTKKSQKSQDHMTCFTCNYSTKNKYDWRKHLQTKKHLSREQEIENENNKNKKKKKIFFLIVKIVEILINFNQGYIGI